jgi:hypothetical protein
MSVDLFRAKEAKGAKGREVLDGNRINLHCRWPREIGTLLVRGAKSLPFKAHLFDHGWFIAHPRLVPPQLRCK